MTVRGGYSIGRLSGRPGGRSQLLAGPATALVILAMVGTTGLAALAAGCKRVPEWERGRKILHYPVRARVGSLDPVVRSSQYDTLVRAQSYETLFSYEYLIQPFKLRPLLAAAMPELSEDKRTYTIELKQGVYFQDDPCFAATDGKGREVVARDVIYSLMRMADRDLGPGGWWLYRNRVVGFDAFQKRMNDRPLGAPFDWDADIPGLRVIDRYRLQIELTRPFPQFLYILAMTYTAVVPRECAQHYGDEFSSRLIGTGPFRLISWTRGSRLIYRRNPTFREERYPTEASPALEKRGLLGPAGQRVPFVDGVVFHIYEQEQPMWLKFRVGDLDIVQVPAEYQPVVYDDQLNLRRAFRDEGLGHYNLALLDFIYRGFNMDDPIVGQGERARYLRQAISLAIDTGEINKSFYNSANVLYDGPIPPGLAGHKAGVISPYRGPDLDKARALMAKAGYPDGKGLPPILFETSRGSNIPEQAEMYSRQLKQIGIKLQNNFNSFPELQEKIKRRKAQTFGLAWGADYPDAENFLQLFYGPNEAPGSNNFNYKNPDYDKLYQQIAVMEPGPERTAIYEKMRDILIEDAPAVGSMARTRFYLWNPRLKNVMPAEVWHHWIRYLDVDIDGGSSGPEKR